MVSVQMLRGSDLFGELNDEKLEQIARLCQEEVYPGRATILQEDEEAQTMYILQDGLVTIRIRSAVHEGGLMVDAVNEQGRAFGWSALIEPRRYTARIRGDEEGSWNHILATAEYQITVARYYGHSHKLSGGGIRWL